MLPESTTSAQPPSYQHSQKPKGDFPTIEQVWDARFKEKGYDYVLRANVAFRYRALRPESRKTSFWQRVFRPESRKTSFWQRVFRPEELQPEWLAFLWVQSRNVPRLMTTGFYWSSANIYPECDTIVDKKKKVWQPPDLHSCYRHHRIYKMFEKCCRATEWRGELHVFSKKFSTVANFNVDGLTEKFLLSARCYNLEGGVVYHFDTEGDHEPFNMIYPGLLLSGSWPWPKAEEDKDNGDGSEDAVEHDETGCEISQNKPA